MTRLPLYAIVASSVFQLACGSTEQEPDLEGGSPVEPFKAFDAEGRPLGKPFEIVNGVISADSNEYGVQAALFLNRDPDETDITVTSSTGKICMHGGITRAVVGDVDSYWGVNIGFIFGQDVETRAPAIVTGDPRLSHPVIPWDFGGGRVIGLAATVNGPALAESGMPLLGFGAGVGGSSERRDLGLELTIYSDCRPPALTTSGDVVESLFTDLENWWCTPERKSRWTASTIDSFWWGMGSQLVNSSEDAGANAAPDPYDFCLSDIQPILAAQ